MAAKILVLDIERQSAMIDGVWELGSRGSSWIQPDRVIEPPRTICFSYRWLHSDKTRFAAEWTGDRPQDNASYQPGGGHLTMIEKAHDLLNEADYVVGWNSAGFDVKHLKAHFWMYDLGPTSPFVNIDLMKQVSRNFSTLAKSMSYISKVKQTEGKVETQKGLWRKLRTSTGTELHKARKAMKQYNIQDVDNTLELYYDLLPWLSGMNLGLFEEDSDTIRCSNCASEHIQYRGQAGNATYVYKRFQCQKCGKWGRDRKSFKSTASVGIS